MADKRVPISAPFAIKEDMDRQTTKDEEALSSHEAGTISPPLSKEEEDEINRRLVALGHA